MPALLQNWSREAQAFVALRDAWAAGVEPQFPWAWRFERVPPTHPLAACVDGYLVWERHFRAPIAAAAPECCASEEDAACAPRDASLDEWEYHILPSTAYGSPELRLRVSRYDGAPRSPLQKPATPFTASEAKLAATPEDRALDGAGLISALGSRTANSEEAALQSPSFDQQRKTFYADEGKTALADNAVDLDKSTGFSERGDASRQPSLEPVAEARPAGESFVSGTGPPRTSGGSRLIRAVRDRRHTTTESYHFLYGRSLKAARPGIKLPALPCCPVSLICEEARRHLILSLGGDRRRQVGAARYRCGFSRLPRKEAGTLYRSRWSRRRRRVRSAPRRLPRRRAGSMRKSFLCPPPC